MLKKLVPMMLVALLMVGLIAPISAQAIYEVYVYTPNGGALNVRDMPSSQGNVIGHVAYGQKVAVDHDLGNGWVELVWGSVPGFVQSRYLVDFQPHPYGFITPTPAKTPKPTMSPEDEQAQEEAKLRTEKKSEKDVATPFYITVRPPRTTSWVNFRQGPSKITTRLASYPEGQELIVEGETNKWYRARDPQSNVVGYIFKDYTVNTGRQVAAAVTADTQDSTQKLGTLNVNGVFDLTCKLPENYTLQVVNMRGTSLVASVLPNNMTSPQMYLSIGYDEMYSDIARLNDLNDEQLAALEATFDEMNEVEISYQNTGYGTKLMIAREVGSDTDFVDILTIYNGYLIEFNMTPNPAVASQTLTNAQIGMCIDFLTNLDFVPAK